VSVPDKSDLHPTQPLLSIIVPVLEPDAELDRCMLCIEAAFLGEEFPDVVIVAPRQYVAMAADRFPRAHVHAESRRGIYAAMNDGVRHSRGSYLYFLGKDDIVLPALQRAVAVLAQAQPFALSCDVYWGSRGLYSGTPSRLKLIGRNLCHQGVIYSRSAFDKHGPYLRRMRVQADHFLNIKILWDRTAGSNVQYFRHPIAWYSGDGFSLTNRDPVFWRLYPTVLRRYVGPWAACLLTVYRKLRGR
jgi:glycosyltransferase involved in cell wall biosynthesis